MAMNASTRITAGIATLLLALPTATTHVRAQEAEVKVGSARITINGTSNIHAWSAASSDVPASLRSALIIGLGVPRYCAEPRSARNSRCRENHITIMLARMPSTSCAMITVIMKAGPCPRSVLNTTR